VTIYATFQLRFTQYITGGLKTMKNNKTYDEQQNMKYLNDYSYKYNK